jgi:predicted heme/steroid binding protein
MVIDSKQEASAAADSNRIITQEELAKHGSAKDCWLLIDGTVYDVTKYLDNHPGGSAVMVEHAGQDCTSNFEDIGRLVFGVLLTRHVHIQRHLPLLLLLFFYVALYLSPPFLSFILLQFSPSHEFGM